MTAIPEIRHNWTRAEVRALFELPFNDLLFRAQQVHRQYFDANAVQVRIRGVPVNRDREDLGVPAGVYVELFDRMANPRGAHHLDQRRERRTIKRFDLYQLRINGRTRRWDVDSYAGGAVVPRGGLRICDLPGGGCAGIQVNGVDQHFVDAGSAVGPEVDPVVVKC